MNNIEQWKAMPRLDRITDEQNNIFTNQYMISNHGRIWSNWGKKILKLHPNTEGYLIKSWEFPKQVKTKGQRGISVRVHRMVAIQFIKNVDNKAQINHKDGNKLNNNVSNLEWCTQEENTEHSLYVLGNMPPKGHESIYSVLSKEQREYIVANYEPRHKTFGARAMARAMGCCHKTILCVLKEGKTKDE